jgi:hypothetical protein
MRCPLILFIYTTCIALLVATVMHDKRWFVCMMLFFFAYNAWEDSNYPFWKGFVIFCIAFLTTIFIIQG